MVRLRFHFAVSVAAISTSTAAIAQISDEQDDEKPVAAHNKDDAKKKQPKPPVKFPLPMITEVHYAVRSGAEGDANGDGDRDAIGDEFIEIINPHKKTIQLKGIMLVDSDAWDKSKGARTSAKSKKSDSGDEVRFVFPDLELKPGQIAVVFNGYHQKTPGPVGTAECAEKTNPNYHDAYVFSMNIGSKYAAFDNAGDWVMLVDPKGTPVQCIRWGQPDHEPPKELRTADAPLDIHASAQRDGIDGEFRAHNALPAPFGDRLFSPGLFQLTDDDGTATGKCKSGSDGGGSNEESESHNEKPKD